MFTVDDEVASGEVPNAVSVSVTPRLINGLGARLVSPSPVRMVSGDTLGPMKSVSLS